MLNIFKNAIMGFWRQFQEYLFLKKRDPDAPNSFNLRAMHGINRISLLMFLFCILVIIYRLIFHRH